MKKLVNTLIVIAVVLFIFLLFGPFYVLYEGEQAVVIRFGKIVRVDQEAGLKTKVPMVDNVVKFSKKILSWDGEPQRIPTLEQQFIWVDTTARWRITDPAKFYSTLTTMERAYSRLDDIIDSAVRTVISANPLREAVRNSNIINERMAEEVIPLEIGEEPALTEELKQYTQVSTQQELIKKGRKVLSDEMLTLVKEVVPNFGIEVIDVIIRQIRYSDDLTESVYQRMIKERNQIAQAYRSFGEGKKQEWLGKLERDKKTILSEAEKKANEVKGQADAEATRIYAEAFSRDPDFFRFWRAVQSYELTLPELKKILSTDMDYFDFLYNPNAR
ncbi:HflC protein [Spirochaeta thermophila DSM 6578]|uniref:Protein HflC n=1 Tax=Winmispira thermophila (strain ATCC 700085 / DSM 6578 / Z-1203) TaxID=869211 RepID=G0GBE3_WINT7|nr:protease modulator HflC [Spirochaeta thermophila]AEJ61952.1 HflC protein [Spirochaeta thermophila DSM 6578]